MQKRGPEINVVGGNLVGATANAGSGKHLSSRLLGMAAALQQTKSILFSLSNSSPFSLSRTEFFY